MKFTKKFKENAALVVLGVVLFWGLTNYDKLFKLLGIIIGVMKPVIFGCIIAFILNVPMTGIEKRLFKKPKNEKYAKAVETVKRPLSIVLTFLLCIGVIALVCWLIVPALIKTFSQLSDDIPVLVTSISNRLNDSPEISNWMNRVNLSTADIINKVTGWLKDGVVILNTLSSTVSFVTSIFSSLVNFFLGIFFAVYMLSAKEKLKSQCKRISRAFLRDSITDSISRICRRSIDTFGNFLVGQTTEAVILGTLCGVGMAIFRFPNALLIAILVACTALIPIVGAFLGYVVGFLLICVTDFRQAVLFLIFMFIIQAIEGNLIYPKVVGNSVGLPSLWTLFAITIGGNLFGIFGMFIAVPVFSVIYCTIGEVVNLRNEKRAADLQNNTPSEGSEG